MNEEATERLYNAAIDLVRCRDEVNRTDGPTAWAALKEADAAHEQAARDFAAAEAEELYERWYRGLPAHNEFEFGREDGHDRLTEALRAGGLAQQQKEVGMRMSDPWWARGLLADMRRKYHHIEHSDTPPSARAVQSWIEAWIEELEVFTKEVLAQQQKEAGDAD